jgi:hypothetical protein
MTSTPPEMVAVGFAPYGNSLLVDREAELQYLETWGANSSPTSPTVLVVTGIGGMGKTSIAAHWFHYVARKHLNLRLLVWCDVDGLEPERALRKLAYEIGTSLGVHLDSVSSSDLTRLLRTMEPFALVLDGFERALAAYSDRGAGALERDSHFMRRVVDPQWLDLLHFMLAQHRNRLLITSRLAIADLENVTGQPITNAVRLDLKPLPASAVEEYLHRSDLSLSNADLERVQEVIGGHPLILRLVAQALKTRTVSVLELGSSMETLVPDRVRQEVVSAGALRLGKIEQAALKVLAEEHGPIRVPDARAVIQRIGGPGMSDSEADRLLTRIEQLNLVAWDPFTNTVSMHSAVQAVIREAIE